MSVVIPENIQGLDEAWKRLDEMEAADAAAEVQSSAANGQRAAQAGNKDTQGQDQSKVEGQTEEPAKAGTPNAEAKTEQQQQQQQQEQTEQSKEQPNKSRYEKARERQEKSWQELNAQKDALKSERESLKTATEQLQKQQTEFETRRKEQEKEFSPETYDDAAAKFEKAGKFDLAELAREKAAALRKNPPQPREAREAAANQQQEAARKEWALKAGQEFPDLAKENSRLQVRVAKLFQQEPELKAHPKGIYLAARLASLEAKAAGVEAKDKELTRLGARVKELEGLTAPSGESAATQLPASRGFDQLSDTEQYAELERQAHEVGAFR